MIVIILIWAKQAETPGKQTNVIDLSDNNNNNNNVIDLSIFIDIVIAVIVGDL